MIVSHALKFAFFHNPKAAGTSMRTALRPYHDHPREFNGIHQDIDAPFPLDFAHLRCWELEALFPQLMADIATYRSLILVRNPYRRFVSAVAQHYRVYCPTIPIAGMAREKQRNLVEDLVLQLSTSIARVAVDFRYVHFSPQIWFIRSGDRQIPGCVVPVDHTGAFHEHVFEYFALQPVAVPHVNASKVDLMHVLDSHSVQSFVQAFYKPDFTFLAADPALAHLVAEP